MLLPELQSPEVAEAASRITGAIAELSLEVETIVLLTPHATTSGVYTEVAGDLSDFGVAGIEGKAETDATVIQALGLPTIEGSIDHGVLVPLLLVKWDVPVVAVGVTRDAQLDLDLDARVGVIASVNLSAGLSARAPLTQIPGAVEAEDEFVAALSRDVGKAVEQVPPGSCGDAVLHLFGRIFEGRPARVLAHEAPVGVGYLVAEVT